MEIKLVTQLGQKSPRQGNPSPRFSRRLAADHSNSTVAQHVYSISYSGQDNEEPTANLLIADVTYLDEASEAHFYMTSYM